MRTAFFSASGTHRLMSEPHVHAVLLLAHALVERLGDQVGVGLAGIPQHATGGADVLLLVVLLPRAVRVVAAVLDATALELQRTNSYKEVINKYSEFTLRLTLQPLGFQIATFDEIVTLKEKVILQVVDKRISTPFCGNFCSVGVY
ncbi:hypothetical protein AVEN_144495-1 [Araneus ventricosus]|uniref:Uncharacterized protein n=1 Tax=Araneus ventricosus TaxID=182803 RepID=A0A4Y2RM80_ARAVE|nr:hypothetical protein AVEN_144495-1 [Araneus ventricosus]